MASAIEITCQDCHGTADKYPTLLTSGPAAPEGGNDVGVTRNSDGSKRFEWREGVLYQRSALWPGLSGKFHWLKIALTPATRLQR